MAAPTAPTEATPSESMQAAALYERAARAYGRELYQVAIDALIESLRLHSSPAARLLLAHSYRHVGRIGSAYTLYKQTVEEVEAQSKKGDKKYQPVLTTAHLNIAQLEPQVPRLVLDVPPDVPLDYAVLLDGVEQPRQMWGTTQTLDPGVHEVIGSRGGQAEVTERVELKLGEQRRINLVPMRPATALVRLDLEGSPADLSIRLDGRPLPKERRDAPLYLDPGRHTVEITAPGYRRFIWERTLGDREQAQVDVMLTPKGTTPKWLFFTTAGLTLAAVVAGTSLGVVAQQREEAELSGKPAESQRSVVLRDEIKTLATAANACFGIAAVLGTTSLVLGFTTRWRTSRSSSPGRVSPSLALGPGSLILAGAF